MYAVYPKLVPRLKRKEGHLRSVFAMLEAGKNGSELTRQLHALGSAIANAKKALIFAYIEHAPNESAGGYSMPALHDIKDIVKYI